jgi:hypothetical protein
MFVISSTVVFSGLLLFLVYTPMILLWWTWSDNYYTNTSSFVSNVDDTPNPDGYDGDVDLDPDIP